MVRDVVCVILWLCAVWVCAYDWEDVAETERRQGLLQVERGQPRGNASKDSKNGNKFPESLRKDNFQDGGDAL